MQLSFLSSIGEVCLVGDGNAITEIKIGAHCIAPCDYTDVLLIAKAQILEYLDGKRRIFDFPIKPYGTKFQFSVWEQIQSIPYGQVLSYGEIAVLIGNPRACRVVGNAVGANPLPIVIPCHRVVSANGIGGFSCGLEIKRKLFAIEGISL